MDSNQYYVYTLARPDGSVFYVGKGKTYRIRQHEQEALRGHNCPKCEVIRSIWQQGGTIQRVIVLETDDAQTAYDYEAELIQKIGREHLTNRTNGGDGGMRKARVRPTPPQDVRTNDQPAAFPGTLTERVQYLFEVRRRPDGSCYSINDIVAASKGMAAKSNLHYIKNGDNTNPTYETLIALALFFKVPIGYFFPSLEHAEVESLPDWTPPP